MILPQTNLQLYRELIRRQTPESDLARVRAAYDASRSLVGNCFRPNHKPFLCHLVGTAGALATWGKPIDVVIAGLLHGVYKFGQFNDGERGPSPRRRDWLRQRVRRSD